MPMYPAIPLPPTITTNQSANFYGELANIISDENPYGKTIFARNLSTPFGNTAAQRPSKLNALSQAGVRVMGWLRDFWSEKPILRCNDRMTISEKQQSFYWLTMHHESGTVRFPNSDAVAQKAFDPPLPCNQAQFDINDPSPTQIQNSPDFELNQVCKAVYVPFEYQTTDGRRLTAGILIGYVGAGGGE